MQQGSSPKIETSLLDGSERRILHNTDILWPEDIVVDRLRGAIFWTDSKKKTIETSFEDGRGRKTIKNYGMRFMVDELYEQSFSSQIFYGSYTIIGTSGFENTSGIFESCLSSTVTKGN